MQESALSIGHFGASDTFRAVLMFLKNSDVKRGTACMHDAIKVLHDAPSHSSRNAALSRFWLRSRRSSQPAASKRTQLSATRHC